jgi:hypothetical protein
MAKAWKPESSCFVLYDIVVFWSLKRTKRMMSLLFNFRETCYWSVQMIVWTLKERWQKFGRKLVLILDCLSISTSRFLSQDVNQPVWILPVQLCHDQCLYKL